MAFVCEFVDASLGMGYGTILSPILIIIGFDPLVAVPAILLSQAFGGLSASIFHHQFKNVSFSEDSKDLKIVLIITIFGISATILASIIAINISQIILKTYIGILVLLMGILVLKNKKFVFSWNKIIGLGILSAFNKGLSGGGFGPVITAGQILSGQKHRNAIGTTTLAEAPICLAGFASYVIARSIKDIGLSNFDMPVLDFFKTIFSKNMLQWELMLALCLGSILVSPFAALATKKLSNKYIHIILGIFIISMGILTLIKTYLL